MGLVRSDHSAAYLRDAVVLDLGEMAAQGQALRERAKRDADRIVSEAEQKVEQLLAVQREEGYRAGYESGYKDGFGQGVEEGRNHAAAQAASDIETSLQCWNDALVHFLSIREQLQQEAKHDVLRLALDMGKRIVHRLVEQDPTIIESQLEETLHLLVTKTKVIIRVNPNDLETAQMILPSLLGRLEHCDEGTIAADATIHPGGCFVRTESGDIDGQIDTQIRRIVETLLPSGGDETDNDPVRETDVEAEGNETKAIEEGAVEGVRFMGASEEAGSDEGSQREGGEAESMLVDSFLSDDSGDSVLGEDRLDNEIESEGDNENMSDDGGGTQDENDENKDSVDGSGSS